MAKKTKYRFCIGRQNRHSGLYTIIVQDQDVYVVSDTKNNEVKLSIHKSGVGQSSYTSEFFNVHRKKYIELNRHIMQMHLLPLSDFYEIVTSFVFPLQQIVSDKKIEKQNVIWVDLPNVDEYVEVVFCRAQRINFKLNLETSGWRAVKTIVLSNNTLFLALYRYMPMREIEYEVMSDATYQLNKYKTQSGIKDKVAATVFYECDNMRYEMEVFV